MPFKELIRKHISKNIPSSKISDYTRAHVLRDVNAFHRERTFIYLLFYAGANGNPTKRRSNNPSLRKRYKYKSEKESKIIQELRTFQDQVFSEIAIKE